MNKRKLLAWFVFISGILMAGLHLYLIFFTDLRWQDKSFSGLLVMTALAAIAVSFKEMKR